MITFVDAYADGIVTVQLLEVYEMYFSCSVIIHVSYLSLGTFSVFTRNCTTSRPLSMMSSSTLFCLLGLPSRSHLRGASNLRNGYSPFEGTNINNIKK